MDPKAIEQLLLQQYGQASSQAKSFSDMLRERTAFVQGSERGVVQQRNDLVNNGSNGVPISPSSLDKPLLSYAEGNFDERMAGIAQESSYNNNATNILKLLQDASGQAQDRAMREREMNMQYGYNEDGSRSTAGLLKYRKELQDQGLPTKEIDEQLRAMGVNPPPDQVTAIASESKTLIDEILGRDTKRNTGLVGGIIPFLNKLPYGQTTQAKIDQLKAKLSLDARKLIKGTGQISDKETAMLEGSIAALTPAMSDEDFRAELGKIRGTLSKIVPDGGSSAGVVDPQDIVNKYWGK